VVGRRPRLLSGRARGPTTRPTASSTLIPHKPSFKHSTRIRVAGRIAVTRSGGAISRQSGSRSPIGPCLSPTSPSRARSWSTSWSTWARWKRARDRGVTGNQLATSFRAGSFLSRNLLQTRGRLTEDSRAKADDEETVRVLRDSLGRRV